MYILNISISKVVNNYSRVIKRTCTKKSRLLRAVSCILMSRVWDTDIYIIFGWVTTRAFRISCRTSKELNIVLRHFQSFHFELWFLFPFSYISSITDTMLLYSHLLSKSKMVWLEKLFLRLSSSLLKQLWFEIDYLRLSMNDTLALSCIDSIGYLPRRPEFKNLAKGCFWFLTLAIVTGSAPIISGLRL